jgi:mono/diheme cytochrome c family protein
MTSASNIRERGPGWWLFVVPVMVAAASIIIFAGRNYFFPGTESKPSTDKQVNESAQLQTTLQESPISKGKLLYTNYCAQCHGDKGEGNGPAARFLYPKPRNFTENQFRIVSTDNHIPSDRDLMQVITNGMPGSAMFPFAHLPEDERQSLVTYVRSLTRQAYEERYRLQAAENKEEVNSEEMAQLLDTALLPGPEMKLPADLPSPSSEVMARGQKLYLTTCAPCHGATGKGDGSQDQRNNDGTPTRPRDFTRGIFKGGRDFRQLYYRLMLGMPGSPMPSSTGTLQPDQAAEIIHHVLSLSEPTAQAKVEHKRAGLLAKRVDRALPADLPDSIWDNVPAVPIVLTPLWWRDYPEPDLNVQALHDGQIIAIRLRWHDETRNDQTVRIQDFEDMAAVQLFKGMPEPFLGMGLTNRAVDVWLWRASWQGNPASYADVDSAYPNMGVDLYPFEQAGKGPRRHAPDLQPRAYLTANAAGNLRSDPTAAFTGNSLEAKGIGTLTMRPRLSQLVSASGSWESGRWTVVLRRMLVTKDPESGITLTARDKLSIAFAIWDGAARDRNGQKLVSIWHDLQLE